jgi:hypothetical protein
MSPYSSASFYVTDLGRFRPIHQLLKHLRCQTRKALESCGRDCRRHLVDRTLSAKGRLQSSCNSTGQSVDVSTVLGSLTASEVKLGFIGLGNMGRRIARRRLDHGYSKQTIETLLNRCFLSSEQQCVNPPTHQQSCSRATRKMMAKIYE